MRTGAMSIIYKQSRVSTQLCWWRWPWPNRSFFFCRTRLFTLLIALESEMASKLSQFPPYSLKWPLQELHSAPWNHFAGLSCQAEKSSAFSCWFESFENSFKTDKKDLLFFSMRCFKLLSYAEASYYFITPPVHKGRVSFQNLISI